MTATATPSRLLQNEGVVTILRSALGEADGLANIPGLLKRTIVNECWRIRQCDISGRIYEFRTFEEFVDALPLEGLGSSMAQLRDLCRRDPEALDLLDKVTQRIGGRPAKEEPTEPYAEEAGPRETFDSVKGFPEVAPVALAPTGNSCAAALRRLRKDRPDLHAEVLAGNKSPHAAMVEAGFRRKSISLPRDPERMAQAIERVFSLEDMKCLVDSLVDAIRKRCGEPVNPGGMGHG
ncbi:MAG: hypothetical protein AMXMBFR33_41290 [Candidatus Xenobia bacterium]